MMARWTEPGARWPRPGDGFSCAWLAGMAGRTAAILLVTLPAWFYGGVQPAVQVWLFAGVAFAMACCLVCGGGSLPDQWKLPVAAAPLLAGLALGAAQLIPLEAPALSRVAPGAARWRALLADETAAGERMMAESLLIPPASTRSPISLYPASTRHDLALLAMASGSFLVGAVLFRGSQSRMWLCGALAVNGAALACFGLAQQLTWNGLLYWRVPMTHGGNPFGPFVNRNSGAGFVATCLAGAIALVVWLALRGSTAEYEYGGATWPSRRTKWRLDSIVARIDAPLLAALGLAGAMIAGILCAMSRGAWLAVAGGTITLAATAWLAGRRAGFLLPIAAALIAGAMLVGWIGLTSAVQTRFASLFDRQIVNDGRIAHWQESLAAVPDFWLLGSGLGTYRYVYPLYEQQPKGVWFYHAENQYLEALLDAGAVGLGLMLLTLVLVARGALQLIRRAESAAFAFGLAGLFAVTVQAIHGGFDFGLYLPANMLLFATLSGAVAAGSGDKANERTAVAGTRWGPLTLAAVLTLVVWGGFEARGAVAARAAQNDSAALAEWDDQAVRRALRTTLAAVQQRTDDAESHERAARLWIRLYRLERFAELRRLTSASVSANVVWEATSPGVMHRQLHLMTPSQRVQVQSDGRVRDYLQRALAHLVFARRACPLLPDVHLELARLGGLVADPASDGIHAERLRRTSPSDARRLFEAGLAHYRAGRLEAAWAVWRESLEVDGRFGRRIIALAQTQLAPEAVLMNVVPESPALVVRLARDCYPEQEHEAIRRAYGAYAERLVNQSDLAEDERLLLRAEARELQGRYSESNDDYRAAVGLRPRDAAWRYSFAVALKRQSRLDEAFEQARLGAFLEPGNQACHELLEEIRRARVASDDSGD